MKPEPMQGNRIKRAGRLWRCRWRRARRALSDERGATALEWTLLLAAIVIPSYAVIRVGVETLIAHYGMITTLNALPFP